jgi:hypothetical protein
MSLPRFIGTYLYWRTNPFVFAWNVTFLFVAVAFRPLDVGDLLAYLPQ